MKTLNAHEIYIAQRSLSFYPGFQNILKNALFMHENYNNAYLTQNYEVHLVTLSNLTGFDVETLKNDIHEILGLPKPQKEGSEVFWIEMKIKSNCIFTPARIFDKNIDFVFDTGCSRSMINYDWFKKSGFLDREGVKIIGSESVTMANGSTATYFKATGIEFTFANKSFKDNVFFLTDGPFLLGNDILSAFNGIEINNQKQTIKLT
jgi:hypothetical protein